MTKPIASGSPRPWGDYDNDGWLDFFFTRLYHYSTNTVNGLFRNNRDGTFTQILTGSPVYDGDRAWAPAWADYDNDGFLDLFIAAGDGLPRRNLLYRNNGNTNHWLKVKLDGRASNRSGIGARVRAQATINGRTFWQVREISCGNRPGQVQSKSARPFWPGGRHECHDPADRMALRGCSGDSKCHRRPVPHGGGAQFKETAPNRRGGQDHQRVAARVRGAGGRARFILEGSPDLVTWTKLMARTSAGSAIAYHRYPHDESGAVLLPAGGALTCQLRRL